MEPPEKLDPRVLLALQVMLELPVKLAQRVPKETLELVVYLARLALQAPMAKQVVLALKVHWVPQDPKDP